MPLFRRPDGRLAKDIAPYRRIMPFLMRGRNESAVYFKQQIDLTKTLPFIDVFNAAHPARRVTVFHLFLWAAVRALAERPRLNRFVSGARVYEREGVWVSYSAKKSLSDDAPIVVLKRQFDPAWSFEQMVSTLHADLTEGRSDKKSHSDKEMSLLLSLPGPLVRLAVGVLRWLDRWNLLPGGFIRNDPFYASLFIANMGSLKMEPPYHHLYEYGNVPIFAALGRKKTIPVVGNDGRIVSRTVCEIRYSFDERIEDGLYCATSMGLLQEILEDPVAAGIGG